MEIHLTPEKEALLKELAARTGQDTTQVIQEAVPCLIVYEIAGKSVRILRVLHGTRRWPE